MRATRRSLAVALVGCVIGGVPVEGQPAPAPPTTGGIVELDYLLQRLVESRRVLAIGAHPDDEDTGLLTLLARGYGAETGYLSLSRGEGGQNLIGEELGVDLGLLRSQELMAARAIDGAHQFFTRAYDFGYSRSLDETSRFWTPDSVLKDAVRVVRRFKPHVIVSVFSGTRRDRHGQHQLAGVTAREAFAAAGDASRFPELATEEGLAPWTPQKLYRSTRFDAASTTLSIPTGVLDVRVGKSFHQIAMASRSRHSSQDMGQLQTIGPAWTRLQLVADRTQQPGSSEAEPDIFTGIERVRTTLSDLADSVRHVISPSRLAEAARPLARALHRLSLKSDEQRDVLERAIAVSAGMAFDARASEPRLVAGQQVSFVVELYNAGPYELTVERFMIDAPDGWTVDGDSETAGPLSPGERRRASFTAKVPHGARLTQPYFLDRPRVGALYDWSNVPPAVRGTSFDPPVLTGRVVVGLLGVQIGLAREVSYRYNDQATGEVRDPIHVVPALDVQVTPNRVVWPDGAESPRTFTVTVTNNAAAPVGGELVISGDGWPVPSSQRFAFDEAGVSRVFAFQVSRPRGMDAGQMRLVARARTDDGRVFERGVRFVDYPHIRRTPRVIPAEADIRVAPIRFPDVRLVGYVRGAADRVPEALVELGLPIEMLTGDALAHEDLSGYDAIIIGSRAYETDRSLVEHNGRLLAYTRAGGLLLVQYQQYQFVRSGFAPYPLTIGRPHGRITDEHAPVTVLEPGHAALNAPNTIASDDWEGWPQERGLYFAESWDEAYSPLLEMRDPDLEPLRGGLLVASYGEGMYVYTGLSFFRALPAGVPGAVRLFLNLLHLGSAGARP